MRDSVNASSFALSLESFYFHPEGAGLRGKTVLKWGWSWALGLPLDCLLGCDVVENDIVFLSCEHVPTRHSTLHVLLQDRSTAVQLRTAKGRVSANLPLCSSSSASPCSFLSLFTVGWTSTDAATAAERKEPSMKCVQSFWESFSRQEWIFRCIIFACCYYLISILCRTYMTSSNKTWSILWTCTDLRPQKGSAIFSSSAS